MSPVISSNISYLCSNVEFFTKCIFVGDYSKYCCCDSVLVFMLVRINSSVTCSQFLCEIIHDSQLTIATYVFVEVEIN